MKTNKIKYKILERLFSTELLDQGEVAESTVTLDCDKLKELL